MQNAVATIRIKNLRLRTYIGIKQEEVDNKQDVIINVEISYPASKASASDNMEDALNYKTITNVLFSSSKAIDTLYWKNSLRMCFPLLQNTSG